MKKIAILFASLLLVLTGCSQKIDIGVATFKLPRDFYYMETEDNSLVYTDHSDDVYTGIITIGTYVDNPEVYGSFEDFIKYIVDEGILEYAEGLVEGSHSVPNQREIELDGKKGYKTMVISESDQFKIEVIHVPVTYDDGETGYFEVLFEYNSPTYPDLSEDFMNSFKWSAEKDFE